MIYFPDLHTHTALCHHADGSLEEYADAAIRHNVGWLGISDHFPAPAGYDAEFRMSWNEFPQYTQMVQALTEKVAPAGLQILFAAEYDFVPGEMSEVENALDKAVEIAGRQFDYLIGSVHFVRGFAFDDPEKIKQWRTFGVNDVWEIYLDNLQQFVEECEFQIIAHPDLPKKFGFFHSNQEYILKRYRKIFETASQKGMALEINTAGERNPAKEFYPSPTLLQLAYQTGMEITFGSDAHSPNQVGYKFDSAIKIAQETGWNHCLRFEKGNAIPVFF